MTLKFGASLTDDTSSINYDRNMFIIKATGLFCKKVDNKKVKIKKVIITFFYRFEMIGGFIYSDQFLQISSLLPSHLVPNLSPSSMTKIS